jgi:hydroxymethylglutaryl-CoA lyase
MADTQQVLAGINKLPNIQYPVLVPNMQGFESALKNNVNEISIFAAASESFSQANINCSIQQSLERFKPVIDKSKQLNIPVRGYISCVLGCPYEGPIDPQAVAALAKQLFDAGCYEISLGDTIGIGTPGSTLKMLQAVSAVVPMKHLAVHFHDTYGQALSNILVSLQCGINVIDSSISGLGGCPYAKGATGNVATEDVLFMLHGLGIETGIDLQKLLKISYWISNCLGVPVASKVGRAGVNAGYGTEQHDKNQQ